MTNANAPDIGLRRVPQGEITYFLAAAIYLDDVDKLYELFAQVGSRVKLRLGGYELPQPADSRALQARETTDLRLESADPYVVFEAGAGHFSIYIPDREAVTSIGLRSGVASILEKRRLWTTSFWTLQALLVPTWASLLVSQGTLRAVVTIHSDGSGGIRTVS